MVTTPKVTLTTSDWFAIAAIVEGNNIADFGWPNGKPVVFRFGWKSPAGTYCFSIRNNAVDRSYVAPFTIAAGQANTDQEIVVAVPAPPSGTWLSDTGAGLVLYWTLANHSSFGLADNLANTWQSANKISTVSQTNGVATVSNTFELFDVGLYRDPDGTGLPPLFEVPNLSDELRRCQRYYQKRTLTSRGTLSSTSATQRHWNFILPCRMRVVPTVTATLTVGSFTGTDTTEEMLSGYSDPANTTTIAVMSAHTLNARI